MQAVAYFCGLWFQWRYNFQSFCCLFWFPWFGTAKAPTGPCWGCSKTGLAHGCLVVGVGRLPRLGCLFWWDLLFSAPSCLPGAPENVSGRRAVSGPWGQRQLPGQVTVHALAESPHLYLLVAQVRLSRNRSLRPCPVATYSYGSSINSLFLGYELAWWCWAGNRLILGRSDSSLGPPRC